MKTKAKTKAKEPLTVICKEYQELKERARSLGAEVRNLKKQMELHEEVMWDAVDANKGRPVNVNTSVGQFTLFLNDVKLRLSYKDELITAIGVDAVTELQDSVDVEQKLVVNLVPKR